MKNKMNYIMISPHFPANFETFTVRLNEAGIRVLGIADEPYENLSNLLKKSLTEYYRVDDMNDYEQMYKAVAFLAYKYGKIDRIESHNEHWLVNDARLRTDFNVFGFKDEEMQSIKYKSKMKAVFQSAGIPTAKGRVVTDLADALEFAHELQYPVIVKPDLGVGAGDTYKVFDDQTLTSIFEKDAESISYIMEEFIDGEIVTYDGLTDQDGNIVFSSTLSHNKAILDILIDQSDMYYWIPREIPQDLEEVGQKCVQAFDIKERFFHFEFFRSAKDDSIIALELNCRPPGGVTIDMFDYANNMDIFKEYANVVKENRFHAKITRPYTVAYVSRQNHYQYKYNDQYIRNHLGNQLVWTNSIPGIFSQLMGSVGYIVKAETEEDLFAAIQYINVKEED